VVGGPGHSAPLWARLMLPVVPSSTVLRPLCPPTSFSVSSRTAWSRWLSLSAPVYSTRPVWPACMASAGPRRGVRAARIGDRRRAVQPPGRPPVLQPPVGVAQVREVGLARTSTGVVEQRGGLQAGMCAPVGSVRAGGHSAKCISGNRTQFSGVSGHPGYSRACPVPD